MPWFAPWPDSIGKRSCRYLLQRYLGQFLERKLDLDQLSVDLYNGTGVVTRLALDCQALNELGENQGWPFEFVDGFIREVNVSVPWATILKDDSFVRVNGLSVTVQPKQRSESVASMFESMWSSMTSSMQLAAECLKQETDNQAAPQPVEAIEAFAQMIDSILCRVKVRFVNTTIRIEHVPKESKTGVALEINIKNMDYLDEAGNDSSIDFSETEKNKTYVVSTFSVKKISFEGVTFSTDEFTSIDRTFSRSVIIDSSQNYKVGDNRSTDDVDHKSTSNPISFARLSGKQEMRLKIKQSEEASGPKIDLQFTLGSITSILSPRQFHVLVELANGLASPHLEDNSNVPLRGNLCMESKPMQKQDFARVEAQLAGKLTQLSGEHGISYLLSKNPWSTASIDDSDQEDEKFLPLASRHDKLMTDSFASTSSMTSSMTSIASSSVSNIPPNGRGNSPRSSRKKKVPLVESDPNAETSHVHIRVASLTLILLHEDILNLAANTDSDCLSSSSIERMKQISDSFFKKLGLFAISGYGAKDLEKASEIFESALTYNHLRIIAAPVILEGNEKTNIQGQSIIGTLTMAKVDIKECLYTVNDISKSKLEKIDVLKFDDTKLPTNNEDMCKSTYINDLSKIPNLKISFNNSQRAVKIGGERKYAYPRTEIRFQLDKCIAEIDISIVDRINSILYSQPICKQNDTYSNMYYPSPLEKSKHLSDFSTEIKITCPLLQLKLRFPIADLRPAHDMSRLPWWQRAVREDYLLINLIDSVIVNTSMQAQISTDVKIQAKQVDIFYLKSEKDVEIHLARATAEELKTLSVKEISTCLYPTMTISVMPSQQLNDGLLDSSSEGENNESIKQSMFSKRSAMGHSSLFMDKLNTTSLNAKDQPGPFSSKKMVHESDTPHSKHNEEEIEELIIPGDASELRDFVDFSLKNSLIQISCSLPVVSVQLPSKHLYEVIYNRINSDLLLWEPSAPQVCRHRENSTASMSTDVFSKPSMKDSSNQVFVKCKSNTNYNSDSDSSSSSSDSNVYYSIYDQSKLRQSSKTKNVHEVLKNDKCGKINNVCFHLKIGKGQLTMYTPVRDNLNHVLPVQQGEIVILVDDFSLCYVGGVGGNVRRGLLSLQAVDANFHHCGLVPTPSEKILLRMYGAALPTYLKHIMYPSNKSVSIKNHNSVKDVISIAISIKPNKDYLGFKTIKIAAGISNVTLYHIMMASQHTWLNQTMDMFDVLDYPIPGYQPSTVITELHVHLWDCAIDYRPLYLPLHTIVTLGSFSISSNVVAKTNASNLRFIAEECALFISDEVKNDKNINLRKDFVCVIDLGLFELSLRLNDKSTSTAPHVDLRASNNVVHVRTCSDSFKALCKLIKYLASDGDFNDPENFDSGASDAGYNYYSQYEKDASSSGGDLLGVGERNLEEIRDLSKSQVQHVNDMMAEAMIENLDIEEKEDIVDLDPEGVEIFYFPDESNNLDPKDSENDAASRDFNPDNAAGGSIEEGIEMASDVTNNVVEVPISIVTKDLGDFNLTPSSKIDVSKPRTKSSSENTDDEFCILGDDFTAVKRNTTEPTIRWLCSEPIHIIENHFSVPLGKTDLLKPPKNFPMAILRYTLCEMTLVWHMYGGNDFKSTVCAENNDSANKANVSTPNKKTVTINDSSGKYSPSSSHRDPYGILSKTPSSSTLYGSQRNIYYQGSVSYNKSTEGITQILPKDRMPGSPREIPWRHKGGPGRRQDILIELQLNKIRFQHETYPNNGVQASRQVLIISSVEIRDRLASSQINKFLYQYTSDLRPKQKHANMVVIKAVHIRPDPKLTAQECCLKVSLLPLRFNIDQDALLFLIGFFSHFGESDVVKDNTINSNNSGSNQSLHSIGGSSRHSTPTHQPPIMSVNTHKDSSRRASVVSKTGTDLDVMISSDCISDDALSIREEENDSNEAFMDADEAERLISENLILLEEDMKLHHFNKNVSPKNDPIILRTSTDTDDVPIYFRNVVFGPDVPIRLDYQGKRVDMTHGPLAGLLMGLAQLNCSELRLKSLSYRHGLLGFERLLKWAVQEWISDIKRRQLPGLLGGVGPMHSLVQLFQGIRDLFWLPIEQYQKDGRLVRGLQRGASSFTTSTAMAALDITARIIHLIQATAETAYDMVSPSPGLRSARGKRRRRHDHSRQPQDVREGIANAYHVMKEGLGETAQTLVEVASSERAARGYSGAVGGVLRQLPPTALAPVLLASEAAVGFLGGVRATLAPADHRDHRDKWRTQPDSNEHGDTGTYSDN